MRPTALFVSWVAVCMCTARGQLTDGTREVVAYAATGPQRAHLWDRRGHWTNRGGDARGRSAEAAVVVLAPEPSPSQTTRRQWNPLQPIMTGPDGTVTSAQRAASPITSARSQTARMRCLAGRGLSALSRSGGGVDVQSVERRVR